MSAFAFLFDHVRSFVLMCVLPRARSLVTVRSRRCRRRRRTKEIQHLTYNSSAKAGTSMNSHKQAADTCTAHTR